MSRFGARNSVGFIISRCSIFVIALTLSSCSFLTSRQALFDSVEEEGPKKQKAPSRNSVSRSEYDALKAKYSDLQSRYNDLKGVKGSGSSTSESQKLLSEINQTKQPGEAQKPQNLDATVDLFSDAKKAAPVSSQPAPPMKSMGKSSNMVQAKTLQTEVERLNQGLAFLKKGNFDKGMVIFKELERSPSKQIQVRAKFYVGEVLFIQKEFDLAMQVFEEIVQGYAFSGIVLKTIGRLIVCSEKLNLKRKRDAYDSILNDFFGAS